MTAYGSSLLRSQAVHTFHIPVMGTGFTIDTPLRVAKYGISSVISLVDDVLIEQMRKYHSERERIPFGPVNARSDDPRADRITAYLNLVDRLVQAQSESLQAAPFEAGSELTRYFELLPDAPLRREYEEMLATTDPARRLSHQMALRARALPGRINVNIMTKLDSDQYVGGQKRPPEFGAAMSALRGFARSTLRSSIVFSAGMNPRLYTYAGQFPDFLPDASGQFKKTIILKVSDYRSAMIQGRFLARRGLWVSEYRIESGLNCGGHAFATPGHLMGPILDQFRRERGELIETLHAAYQKALTERGITPPTAPLPVGITAQGGIGTPEENAFLMAEYDLLSTGWGTPFLLVPEVTNVDAEHRARLARATGDDVYLSDSSPLGIPFWNLRTSASEEARRQRIDSGNPGSKCPKGFLVSNTEFTTVPLCTASKAFQTLKLRQLSEASVDGRPTPAARGLVTVKSCICHDLAGGVTLGLGIDPKATPAVCCGPNIVNFGRTYSLREMVDHIYGRVALELEPGRPHMFLRELALYVDHLRDQAARSAADTSAAAAQSLQEFRTNLLAGIDYYRSLAESTADKDFRAQLQAGLEHFRGLIESMADRELDAPRTAGRESPPVLAVSIPALGRI